MTDLLFPNWLLFAGFYLFLRIYNPTRLYLDNTSCLAIAIVLAMFLARSRVGRSADYAQLLTVVVFALFVSVPYWISGTLGGVIQQLLLLNEQSVQDRRFTDESEALAKISSLVFTTYALTSGSLFRPILDVINGNVSRVAGLGFGDFFELLTNSLRMMVIVSGKYIIVLMGITLCCGYVDLFFKKASLSMVISPNLKAVAVIILLNLWLLHDEFFIFKKMMLETGYG